MSRYSSDSDSSYYAKGRRKKRSCSTSSSGSSKRRKSKSFRQVSTRYKKSSKSYSSRNYRRSRSRSKTNSRRSRSSSRDQRRRKSRSQDKYRHKRHYKSRSRSGGRNFKYHSRSSSNDSKSSSSSFSNSSKSSSNTSYKKSYHHLKFQSSQNSDEHLREKLLKAIKAAESADHLLKQQGVLPKGVKSRNDLSSLTNSKPQTDIIRDINADEFVPKVFTSSKQKKEENYDELNIPSANEVAHVPDVDVNSIFHASFYIDPKAKLDRWIKKLFLIRQRANYVDSLHSSNENYSSKEDINLKAKEILF